MDATDILVGKGRGLYTHPGNIRFSRAIEMERANYEASDDKNMKTRIINEIVVRVKLWGRFLSRDDNGHWQLASDDLARKKVGQALRFKRRKHGPVDRKIPAARMGEAPPLAQAPALPEIGRGPAVAAAAVAAVGAAGLANRGRLSADEASVTFSYSDFEFDSSEDEDAAEEAQGEQANQDVHHDRQSGADDNDSDELDDSEEEPSPSRGSRSTETTSSSDANQGSAMSGAESEESANSSMGDDHLDAQENGSQGHFHPEGGHFHPEGGRLHAEGGDVEEEEQFSDESSAENSVTSEEEREDPAGWLEDDHL